VFVAGLSAGGAMAAILGAAYPDVYAAIGVHSGLAAGSARDMISGLQAMKKPRKAAKLRKSLPVIVFHGDGDGVVHPGNGESVLRQYIDAHGGRAGLREHTEQRSDGGRSVTRTSWQDDAGANVAEHWVLHGAAHAWAGGRASGSHTDTTGPSASAEMLRFFLAATPSA
jgi:poly(3-hydroxybutyrate) depolymerase